MSDHGPYDTEKNTLLDHEHDSALHATHPASKTVYLKTLGRCLVLFVWAASILVAFSAGKSSSDRSLSRTSDLRKSTLLPAPTTSLFEPLAHTQPDTARDAIELHDIQFTGAVVWAPNGSEYRDIQGVQYVGEPSPEIDQAWDDIFPGTGVDLTEDQARAAGLIGQTYQKPSGHYLAGISVFHDIHCLNKLRRATRLDYYRDSDGETEQIHRMHLDHCIDALRQSIMCYGDLSPLNVKWSEAQHRPIFDVNAVHTCRNFDKLKQWADEYDAFNTPLGHATDEQRAEEWYIEMPRT